MNSTIQMITSLMDHGSISIPTMLITHYKRLNLSETDLALLLHLIVFREKENVTFPTIVQMQARMSTTPEAVIGSLERLTKQGIMTIEEFVDANTGIRSEQYHIQPLYEKLAQLMVADMENATTEVAATRESSQTSDIFTSFEKEFGRPLTPMECEMISKWLDQEEYSDPLIRAALKEAVFAGKVHFRYIDRILLEWSRNRVRTPEEAREYAKRFRGR